jgi:hypothetical protein
MACPAGAGSRHRARRLNRQKGEEGPRRLRHGGKSRRPQNALHGRLFRFQHRSRDHQPRPPSLRQSSDDNLLPYGGGGTLNEIDGNFTLNIGDTGLYRFHWLGKIRGLPFDPLHFRIDKMDSPDVVTVEDARVKMPVMFPVDEEAVEARDKAVAGRDEALLKALAADPGAPMSALAAAARIPRCSIQRALARLGRNKLAHEQLGKWVVTRTGKEALKGAKTTDTANRYDTSLT